MRVLRHIVLSLALAVSACGQAPDEAPAAPTSALTWKTSRAGGVVTIQGIDPAGAVMFEEKVSRADDGQLLLEVTKPTRASFRVDQARRLTPMGSYNPALMADAHQGLSHAAGYFDGVCFDCASYTYACVSPFVTVCTSLYGEAYCCVMASVSCEICLDD